MLKVVLCTNIYLNSNSKIMITANKETSKHHYDEKFVTSNDTNKMKTYSM